MPVDPVTDLDPLDIIRCEVTADGGHVEHGHLFHCVPPGYLFTPRALNGCSFSSRGNFLDLGTIRSAEIPERSAVHTVGKSSNIFILSPEISYSWADWVSSGPVGR